MIIGTRSPKRGKYKNLDVGVMQINADEFEKFGRIELILESTRKRGSAQYPKYVVCLSGNEIKELNKSFKDSLQVKNDKI